MALYIAIISCGVTIFQKWILAKHWELIAYAPDYTHLKEHVAHAHNLLFGLREALTHDPIYKVTTSKAPIIKAFAFASWYLNCYFKCESKVPGLALK